MSSCLLEKSFFKEGGVRHFGDLSFSCKYIDTLIYLPDLVETSIEEFDVLLLPSQLHMGLLMKSMDKIYEFANRGGIIVSFGPQLNEWIPGHNWEFRETNFWWWLEKDPKRGLVLQKPDHDLFSRYLTLADSTWHQHGIYWPPEGSDILLFPLRTVKPFFILIRSVQKVLG
ncbi:hypothetical protein ACQKKK_20840 [Peribacillus sp. NPDC006672]|uniref:hypothetical protein n=1 Tax=Peribacillus sp. NPDC006672 TaxID=3390606 RepID=UPI003D086A0F